MTPRLRKNGNLDLDDDGNERENVVLDLMEIPTKFNHDTSTMEGTTISHRMNRISFENNDNTVVHQRHHDGDVGNVGNVDNADDEDDNARVLMDQLEQVAGIRPSWFWWNACRTHLLELQLQQQQQLPPSSTTSQQQQCNSSNFTVDAYLYYVLQSDLRDVVRHPTNSSDNDISHHHHHHHIQLRRALEQSMSEPPHRQILPLSFGLMVQIEEVLDVSKNASCRYDHGPVPSHDPTPIGNQRQRCLKLYLSDGYDHENHTFRNENDADYHRHHRRQYHMVAMEVSPIPDLSVHSKAGCKMLLRGPIEVRHGMILLGRTTGNVVILGGHVPSLIPIQEAAVRQAQRLAGVDATVRALIGDDIHHPLNQPHDDNDDDDNHDVGEQESRDVPSAPPPALPTLATTIRPTNVGPSTIPSQNHQGMMSSSVSSISSSSSTLATHAPPPLTAVQPISHISSLPIRYVDMETPTTVVAQAQSTTYLEARTTTATMFSSQPPTSRHRTNPYVAAATTTTSATSAKSPTGPYHTSSSPTPPELPLETTFLDMLPQPPPPQAMTAQRQPEQYQPERLPTNASMVHDIADSSSSSVQADRPHQSISHYIPESNQDKLVRDDNDNDDQHRQHHHAATSSCSAPGSTPSHLSSSTSNSLVAPQRSYIGEGDENHPLLRQSQQPPQHNENEEVSFAQLIRILQQSCQDRTVYQQNIGKIWIVTMQHHIHLDFNIAKRKNVTKEAKKQGQKYDYVMTAKFGGGSLLEDGLITCNISNSILEPYFGFSPAEMRKLRREDRDKAQTIVGERGRAVSTDLKVLQSFQTTLWCQSPNEFFSVVPSSQGGREDGNPKPIGQIDGNCPILLILRGLGNQR